MITDLGCLKLIKNNFYHWILPQSLTLPAKCMAHIRKALSKVNRGGNATLIKASKAENANFFMY